MGWERQPGGWSATVGFTLGVKPRGTRLEPPVEYRTQLSPFSIYSGIKLKAHGCRRGMTPTTVNLSTLTDLAGDSTEPTNVFSSGNDYELPTENNGNSESAEQNHSELTAGEDGTAAWLSQHYRLQTTLSHPKRRSTVGIPRPQSCGGSQSPGRPLRAVNQPSASSRG